MFHQMGAPLTSQEAQLMQPANVVKRSIQNKTRFWFRLDMLGEAASRAPYLCAHPGPSCRLCRAEALDKPARRMKTGKRFKRRGRTLLVPKFVERVEIAMSEHTNLSDKLDFCDMTARRSWTTHS